MSLKSSWIFFTQTCGHPDNCFSTVATIVTTLVMNSNDVFVPLVLHIFAGEEFNVKAKCIVNATGPYTDFIRELDDSSSRKICQPSSGVHIVLPDYYRSFLYLPPCIFFSTSLFVTMQMRTVCAHTRDQGLELYYTIHQSFCVAATCWMYWNQNVVAIE